MSSLSTNDSHGKSKRLRMNTLVVGVISLVAATTNGNSIALPTISAFSSSPTTTKITTHAARRKTAFQFCATATDDVDTISMLAARIEEEMLSGPEQSILFEMEESKRRTIWKQLDKAARSAAKSKSKSSGGGGFGGGGSSKKKGANDKKTTKVEAAKDDNEKQQHLEFDLKKDKSKFGAQIVEQGVARINGRLSKETMASLLEYINGYLEQALTTKVEDMSLEEIYKQQSYFADVQGKLNRRDMLLPLEESPTVQTALWELLVKDSVLSDSVESILGDSAQLYELGALISDPGSERQLLHADYNYQPDFQPDIPPALTCFVALQDIDERMGPTTFLPSSATKEYHEEIAIGQQDEYGDGADTSELLSAAPNNLATLGTGDCSLYNPMTLHCGGANRSDKRRVIFYFSFKNKKYDEKDWPLAYASLRSDLRARQLSLTEIQTIVADAEHNENENDN